jgi:Fe-S oxidoreductase
MENQFLEPYLSSLYTCIKCRDCMSGREGFRQVCPMTERYGFFSYSGGGMVTLGRGIWEGAVEWSKDVSNVIYNCTMCGGCAENCENTAYLTNEYFNQLSLVQMMRRELVNRGFAPPLARDYFKSILQYGNPFKLPEEERGKWAEGTGIEPYSGQEYLYYVGDIGSYDERGQKCARAVGECLIKLGVSFGILGDKEVSDGNEVNTMGECAEDGLFQFLAEKNIQQYNEMGIKKVVTLSPHGYNAMKNEYPRFGGDFEVVHYTELLSDLTKHNDVGFSEYEKRVTYHDPCYLGRHNNQYDAPRNVLKALQGIDLIEMESSREHAFCCGGGGGNFFTDMLGNHENSPNRIRARQAYERGAEVLAVACPMCAKMLEDGIKAENLEERMQVKDIAEIINASLGVE